MRSLRTPEGLKKDNIWAERGRAEEPVVPHENVVVGTVDPAAELRVLLLDILAAQVAFNFHKEGLEVVRG